jgi:uncharacterized membrane protein YqaE (UPF0057 family)
MNLTRVILCVICPPLAVIDRGCGSILIVTILTIAGGVPGIIGALIILNNDGYIKKGFENSFVISIFLTILIGFVILVLIYILFYR